MKESAKHFLSRMVIEAREAMNLPPDERREGIRDWLGVADANQMYISIRMAGAGVGRFAPNGDWLEQFDELP